MPWKVILVGPCPTSLTYESFKQCWCKQFLCSHEFPLDAKTSDSTARQIGVRQQIDEKGGLTNQVLVRRLVFVEKSLGIPQEDDVWFADLTSFFLSFLGYRVPFCSQVFTSGLRSTTEDTMLYRPMEHFVFA